MTFYKLTDDSNGNCRYAYAMGFYPLADTMPFILESELERKNRFWEISEKGPPGIIIGGGGRLERANAWPDILGHGAGWPMYFISENVVQSLNQAGIPFARLTEMPVAEVNPPKLKSPPPKYYVLEAAPGIEMDYVASKVPTDSIGKPIPHLYPLNISWKLKRDSWTGLDLFCRPNVWNRPTCSLICTEKVVELAKHEGWTNAKFEPVSAV